jgi:Plavaka transposase
MSKQVNKDYTCDICLCTFQSKRSLTWHLSQCTVETSTIPLQCSFCNATFYHQKGLLIHLDSVHPGKSDSNDTHTPNTNTNSVENNDDEPFVTSGESYIDYSNTHDNVDECATMFNYKTKHAKVSFQKVLKYSYREMTSSNSSCSTHDDNDEYENSSLNKPTNINGYSKDDFKEALVNLQYHVENQENEFEQLNRKQCSTEIDEDFDAGMLIIADSAMDAAQEAVLNVFPEGIENDTVEIADQNDESLVTMQSHLQHKHDQQDQRNQHMLCQVQLLQLLDNCNAPLHLFDDIIRWTRGASIIHSYDFEQPAPSRRYLVKDLIHRNNLAPLLPNVIQFKLPKAKQTVKVITHNVTAAIHSLLSDKDLMKPEHLIFHNNPLEDPNANDKNIIKDVNDGSCYKNAYTYYCSNKYKDVLCPIILFIDKTHTDAKGNLTLEPVCITLGIFNQKTRNKEEAWRIIGFIPNLDGVSKKILNSDEKHSDYHSLLNVVLAPLAVLQTYNGLAWKMHYNDVLYEVILKVPILFICGDSEGQDKLVGRRMLYSGVNGSFTGHICRYCDVPYDETDNPSYKGKLTKASEIANLLAKRRTQAISGMGYLNIEKNALHQLKFCDWTYGLNGSVPADMLHTFQLGIYIYVLDGLFGEKKASIVAQKKRKRVVRQREREQQDSDHSDESDSATINTQGKNLNTSEMSTRNIFNAAECDRFDASARQYGKLLSRQSDRNLPRCNFPSGITGGKKMVMRCRVWFLIF